MQKRKLRYGQLFSFTEIFGHKLGMYFNVAIYVGINFLV